jgi:hypothetical protein
MANYQHPHKDPNLSGPNRAMEYDADGEPVLRVSVEQTKVSPTGMSAFGENLSVTVTPVIQLDALYGYDPREFQIFQQFGGVVDPSGTLFKCHTNTDPYGYAVIRSNRIIRYRPGQGVVARFTAAFDNPQIGVTLRAGLFSQEQGLNIGYDDVTGQFGILRQNGGKAEIWKLTITAASGNGNVTITLNGVAHTVALVSDDALGTAAQIASNTFAGWTVEQCDDSVRFLSNAVGAMAGAFTMTGTVSTGVFTHSQVGVANTNNWTYQSEWNVDTMDGNGPSGVTMDWSKLNIFQVSFRWLGAGEIRWAMENPVTGDIVFIHHEHYSNRNTDVHLNNPSFRMGYVAANLSGNTITDAHVCGASMLAAIEGDIVDNSYTTAVTSGTKSGLAQNVLHNVISVKNSAIYKDKINLREVKLKTFSVSSQNNSPIELYFILNANLSVTEEWTKIGDFSSVVKHANGGTITLSNEQPVVALIGGINGTNTFNLSDYHITLPPGQTLSIAVKSAQQIQEINAGLTWSER